MWCPSFSAFKIGYSGNVPRRLGRLRATLDSGIKLRATYPTPVSAHLLEVAMHTYFRHLHMQVPSAGEPGAVAPIR
jgi:hypothetical protein